MPLIERPGVADIIILHTASASGSSQMGGGDSDSGWVHAQGRSGSSPWALYLFIDVASRSHSRRSAAQAQATGMPDHAEQQPQDPQGTEVRTARGTYPQWVLPQVVSSQAKAGTTADTPPMTTTTKSVTRLLANS